MSGVLTEKTVESITDARGRTITIKELGFKDRHRLFRAVGKAAQGNEAFLADCMMFASVVSIDGVPVPPPNDKSDVEPIIDALGDDGCEAVQAWFAARAGEPDAAIETAKN